MLCICTLTEAIDTVAPLATREIREALLNNLELLKENGINTGARIKPFLAQMSHESMGFTRLVEVRSDSSADRKYGPQTRVGEILGNTEEGDGSLFKGRGIIQLTGRWNYGHYGRLVRLNLLTHPELAADPDTAVQIAVAYWNSKGLNRLADEGRFEEITRKINGGLNGLHDRLRRLVLLNKVDI